jgi:hypothetical protein
MIGEIGTNELSNLDRRIDSRGRVGLLFNTPIRPIDADRIGARANGSIGLIGEIGEIGPQKQPNPDRRIDTSARVGLPLNTPIRPIDADRIGARRMDRSG